MLILLLNGEETLVQQQVYVAYQTDVQFAQMAASPQNIGSNI